MDAEHMCPDNRNQEHVNTCVTRIPEHGKNIFGRSHICSAFEEGARGHLRDELNANASTVYSEYRHTRN